MAVVKIKYTRGRRAIKAHLRYITHRRGRDEKTVSRSIFGSEGAISKEAAYQLIDAAKPGTVFYKMIISPDPKREDARGDLNLWQLTHRTLVTLRTTLNQDIRFLAVEHNDHTPNRHVHAIFLIPGKLSRQEFRALATSARLSATEEARLQRRVRDLLLNNPRSQTLTHSLQTMRQGGGGGAAPRRQGGCRSCGYGELEGIPSFYHYCPACHVRLNGDRQSRLRMEVRR
jgi:hypothetical protein